MYPRFRVPFPISRRLLPLASALLIVASAPLARAAPYAYIASYATSTVSVVDMHTNTILNTIPITGATYPQGVAVSPDGQWVYVTDLCGSSGTCTGGNGFVTVIDATNDSVAATIPVGVNPLGVAVSPDGNRVYVANQADSTVSVIDATTKQVVATIPMSGPPFGIAVSPTGNRVYVTTNPVCNIPPCPPGNLTTIDTGTDTAIGEVGVGILARGVAVSPDGSRAYVANRFDNTVSVIDTTTNLNLATIGVGSFPMGIDAGPDGSVVYVANSGSDNVSVIDTATDTMVREIPAGSGPAGLAVSPDGSRVYVADFSGSSSGSFSAIDTAASSLLATVTVGDGPISLGRFVGPGPLIAANSSASSSAGAQATGTVTPLVNKTSCASTDMVVQNPRHGTVNFSASDGAFTYTPASSTYSGPDAFTWSGQASLSCLAAFNPSLPVSNTAAVSLVINPVLTGLADLTLAEGGSAQEAFSLAGSAPFTHVLASNNATVLPPSGVTITPAACGTTGNLACTLALTAATATGTASVTVTATDKYGDPVTKTVRVTVAAPPSLSGFSNLSLTAGNRGSESVTLGGTGTLSVTASSSNTTVLPDSDITGQSACTAAGVCPLTINAPANQSGTATVNVTVKDAYGQSATGSFDVTVTTGTVTGPTSGSGGGGGGTLAPSGLILLSGLLGLALLRRRRGRTPAGEASASPAECASG